MGQFDSRFSMLLKSPLIEDPNKSLRQPEVPISSHLLDPILPVGKPKGRGKLIVKPAYVVTWIKGSPVFKATFSGSLSPNYRANEPVFRGHLFSADTFSGSL